jgi:hypothetical protein
MKLQYINLLSDFLLILSSIIYSTVSRSSSSTPLIPSDHSFELLSKGIVGILAVFVNCTITTSLALHFIEDQQLLFPSLFSSIKRISLFILNEPIEYDDSRRCKMPHLLESAVLFISKIFHNVVLAGKGNSKQKINQVKEAFDTHNGISSIIISFSYYFEKVADSILLDENSVVCDIPSIILEAVRHICACIMILCKGVKVPLLNSSSFSSSILSLPSSLQKTNPLGVVAFITEKMKDGVLIQTVSDVKTINHNIYYGKNTNNLPTNKVSYADGTSSSLRSSHPNINSISSNSSSSSSSFFNSNNSTAYNPTSSSSLAFPTTQEYHSMWRWVAEGVWKEGGESDVEIVAQDYKKEKERLKKGKENVEDFRSNSESKDELKSEKGVRNGNRNIGGKNKKGKK